MNMLKGFFTFGLCTALLLSGGPAFGAYLGDTAIYSATAVPTTASHPNVLFIIDNSYASLNTAQGEAYVTGRRLIAYTGDNKSVGHLRGGQPGGFQQGRGRQHRLPTWKT